jgi:hypothetical protein
MTTFDRWMHALEARHLSELRFSEVSRALRALSATYVERRHGLARGAALAGAGKRAAFALFYGPLHYLLVRAIVTALPEATSIESQLVDLGCGTGASGAAWAGSCTRPPAVVGIDKHPWALQEAERTYRDFGLSATLRRRDLGSGTLPKGRSALLAAFTLNELAPATRDSLLRALLRRASSGDAVLVVEPLARFVAPWWDEWRHAFERVGGRADDWRVRPAIPPIVAKLDRAAGLDHRELTGRSLWLRG